MSAELRPRFGGCSGVLPPDPCAVGAPVPADPHPQGGGPPPQWQMRKLPHHRAPWDAFAATVPAPPIILGETAFQDCSVAPGLLASDRESEGVEEAEAVEVRTGESRLRHVEVFQMGSVGTPIFGRPRPLSTHRHADPATRPCFYTLKREEPY